MQSPPDIPAIDRACMGGAAAELDGKPQVGGSACDGVSGAKCAAGMTCYAGGTANAACIREGTLGSAGPGGGASNSVVLPEGDVDVHHKCVDCVESGGSWQVGAWCHVVLHVMLYVMLHVMLRCCVTGF